MNPSIEETYGLEREAMPMSALIGGASIENDTERPACCQSELICDVAVRAFQIVDDPGSVGGPVIEFGIEFNTEVLALVDDEFQRGALDFRIGQPALFFERGEPLLRDLQPLRVVRGLGAANEIAQVILCARIETTRLVEHCEIPIRLGPRGIETQQAAQRGCGSRLLAPREIGASARQKSLDTRIGGATRAGGGYERRTHYTIAPERRDRFAAVIGWGFRRHSGGIVGELGDPVFVYPDKVLSGRKRLLGGQPRGEQNRERQEPESLGESRRHESLFGVPLARLDGLGGQMPQLGQNQPLQGQPNRTTRARDDENHPAPRQTRNRARQQCRGSDVLIREHPEEFAETRHFAFEEWRDALGRNIAGRNPGAPREDHPANALAAQRRIERRANRLRLVLHDFARGHSVTARFEQLGHQRAARIVFERARVAHGDDRNRHSRHRILAVMVVL